MKTLMRELGLCMYLCGLFGGFKGKLTENSLRDVFAKDFYNTYHK
jgi:hypothetical protein